MLRTCLVSFAAILLAPVWALAGDPFHYPEATHGKGKLQYISGMPVLFVEGAPEEIGEQEAVLGVMPAAKLLTYPRILLKATHADLTWPLLIKTGSAMLDQFPADHRKEFDAMVKKSKADRDALIAGNTMFDLKKIFGCSTLIVEADHSATKGPLFGRNLDFPTCGFLQEYTLVEIVKPKGKHAFVSIGFPGMLGCLSGMNDAGLSLAVLEVHASADDSLRLDPGGIPYGLCFRQLLEECTTVAEAEKALRSMKRTTWLNLAICDKKGGVVFEVTPKHVEVRGPEKGICACTNHFRTKELAANTRCKRYDLLIKNQDSPTLDLIDIAKQLDAVNQGKATLHTMIFEPAALKLHLAFGKCPSSNLPMKELDLGKLFKEK